MKLTRQDLDRFADTGTLEGKDFAPFIQLAKRGLSSEVLEEALKVYAGEKPSWAVWETDTKPWKFLTFDDFGGVCLENWGPYHAKNALLKFQSEIKSDESGGETS